MRIENVTRLGVRILVLARVGGWMLGWGASWGQGQTVRIRYRPLTPQDIKNAGLTNTTQTSGGAPNAGVGQPIYLEALVQTGTVVSSVNWTLIGLPTNSVTTMMASPLSNSVPAYDGGDRVGVCGRPCRAQAGCERHPV